MAYSTILVDKKDGVAKITINRPDDLNALSPQVLSELIAAFREIDRDESIVVIVLRGAGRCFCAGLDLKVAGSWLEAGDEVGVKTQLADPGFEVGEVIDNIRQPVIAAVHGYAITGGFYLAYCCDIVVASEDASFQDTHIRWGLVPAWQESQRLLKLVGAPKAKYLFYTSHRASAREMEAAGLVSKVVPEGKLDEAIDEVTAMMLRQSPAALAMIKTQLSRGMKTDWLTAVKVDEWSRKGLFAGFMTKDALQRIKDFREKRAKA
jgi:enoyl-CoA hydratase/carnithine racemase